MFFKKGEEYFLQECFKSWLILKMPELHGFINIHFYISKTLPFDWLPGNRESINGITLWNGIYLRKNKLLKTHLNDENFVLLLLHELVHIGQFLKNPVKFPIQYLWHYQKFGYWNMPAEIEAREVSERLLQEFLKENPCKNF